MRHFQILALTTTLLLSSGCSSDSTEATSRTEFTSTSVLVTPPTTGEFGNLILEPAGLRGVDFEALNRGETVVADWAQYSSGIQEGRVARYHPDRRIADDPAHRSQFPEDWDVFVANDQAHDGPGYIILGVRLTRLDARTLEMREGNTGDLVANFVLDETDPADWEN